MIKKGNKGYVISTYKLYYGTLIEPATPTKKAVFRAEKLIYPRFKTYKTHLILHPRPDDMYDEGDVGWMKKYFVRYIFGKKK